jgi:hypothetical protein
MYLDRVTLSFKNLCSILLFKPTYRDTLDVAFSTFHGKGQDGVIV